MYRVKNAKTALTAKRVEKGLTRNKLAEIIDISPRTLEKYEQQRISFSEASVAIAYKIAKALDCSIEDLIDEK